MKPKDVVPKPFLFGTGRGEKWNKDTAPKPNCPFYKANCLCALDAHIQDYQRCGGEPCKVLSPVRVHREDK